MKNIKILLLVLFGNLIVHNVIAQESRATEIFIANCPDVINCVTANLVNLRWTNLNSGYTGNSGDIIPVVGFFYESSSLNFNTNGNYVNGYVGLQQVEFIQLNLNPGSYCSLPLSLVDPITMVIHNKVCTYDFDGTKNSWVLSRGGESSLFADIPGTEACTQSNSACLSAFLTAYSLRMQYAEQCKKWAGNCDQTSTIYLPNEKGLFAIGTDNASDGAYITGGILTDRVKVMPFGLSGLCWPDYVFEPGYDLMSLDDVKSHIDTKGHLPGFPSGHEVDAAGGFELNQITLLQQEKIEELMLHLIELKKQIITAKHILKK